LFDSFSTERNTAERQADAVIGLPFGVVIEKVFGGII
jgi:hypothetical protein